MKEAETNLLINWAPEWQISSEDVMEQLFS